MTRATAKTLLKRYGFDDSDPLTDWLDEAVVQFENSSDWPFLQKVTTVSAVAVGANTLTVASNIFKIQSLRNVTAGNKLTYLSVTDFERSIDDPTDRGVPIYYIVTGLNTIQFYPVLDTPSDFRVVYQEELTLPSELASDGTSMPGPKRVHYAYVLGAAYIALQSENEEERAQTALTQFEANVDRTLRKMSDQTLDEPDSVVDVMGYSL